MSSKLILKGLNTEVIGNEERLMWALPLFEVDSKHYAVIKTPWSLEDETSILPVDIETWLGSKIVGENKEIHSNSVVLVFGTDYYNLLKKYNYHHLFRGNRSIYPIKPDAFLWIGKPDNLIDWVEKLFSSLLEKLDFLFSINKPYQKKEEKALLKLIKGTVGLVENDYLEFRIRELFKLLKYNEISKQEKMLFLEELSLDVGLDKQKVMNNFSSYSKKMTPEPDDSSINSIRVDQYQQQDQYDAFQDSDVHKVLKASADNTKKAEALA